MVKLTYRFLLQMASDCGKQMAHLDRAVLDVLETEVKEFEGTGFTGILVGKGSLILHFTQDITTGGPSILMQCPFEVKDKTGISLGHGENPETAMLLIPFLNETVCNASADEIGHLNLEFQSGKSVRVLRDDTWPDSFELRTRHGITPV
jgi:hypothetical protein